jgi:D-alanyl-D-alanine carboxypeptidase
MTRTLAALLFLTSYAVAAPAMIRPRFTVQLNVQVSETSKEALISDMTTALKKLSDVEVTSDGKSVWILDLNVTPIMDKKGLQGYAISTVIADRNASKTLQALPPEDFQTPAANQAVKDLAAKLVDVHDHLMLTCAVNDLTKAYAQIVDYFDENYLSPVREEIDNYNFDQSKSIRRGL